MKTGQKITWMRYYGKGPLTNGTIKHIVVLKKGTEYKQTEKFEGEFVDYINHKEHKEFIIIAENESKDDLLWLYPNQIMGGVNG